MFCMKCGSALAPAARFCPRCGTSVAGSFGPPSMKRPGIITVLAVLNFIAALFGLAILVLALASDGKSESPMVDVMAGGFFAVLTAISVATGVGLWNLKPWGRVAQIALSCLGLLAFPVGTLVSGLILWYLFTPPAKVLFSGKRADQLTHAEVAALHTSAAGASTGIAIVVGLLIGVAMLGIVAAIAIPNLLTAMQRSKQKRTLADLTTISNSVIAYADEHRQLPTAESPAQLLRTLKVQIPPTDAWEREWRYGNDGENFWLVSAGKDGLFESDDIEAYDEQATTNFNADIVMINGNFIRYPEGTKTTN